MRLDRLAPEFNPLPAFASTNIRGLTADSRDVMPGYLFAALSGVKTDGGAFIDQAIARGAAAVLVAKPAQIDTETTAQVAVLQSENPRRDLALMAKRFFATQPQHVVAITGTNGKTSTAQFVQQILAACGHTAASLGTLGVQSASYQAPLNHTTPDPVTLSAALRDLVAHQITHVALEASSHGLAQYRLDGTDISVAGFTNLSRDHLDYHKDEADYLAAKQRLFTEVLSADGTAVVTVTREAGQQIADAAARGGRSVMRVGTQDADLYVELVSRQRDGLVLRAHFDNQQGDVTLPLVGDFQIENVQLAMAISLQLGCAWGDVLASVSGLVAPMGRLQKAGETSSGASVYVDYAHTPDALANALNALRAHMHDKGALHVVFGCGGDRDVGKRPLMGEIAAHLADQIIVTDDNPRHEEAAQIRQAILAQCPLAQEIADRGQAIDAALVQAQADDIVLVAGKGHETGQIIGDTILPFNDVTYIAQALGQSEVHHG
ncbi:MAG: UDP-N-acetylmuramoyl-L-alanyl-D-glutamate--2,6-diaminopimelate ligase [Parvibaculales bacterium]